MRITNCPLLILLAGLVAVAGCGKTRPPPPAGGNGVKIDVPKLRQAFAGAPSPLQRNLTAVTMAIRYGQNAQAIAALEKLAGDPDLTEPQKKACHEVLDQLKPAVNQAPAKPAP